MNLFLPTIGSAPAPIPTIAQRSRVDEVYNLGMTLLNANNEDSFNRAVSTLKEAADMGHKDARVVLRSLCDGHARKRLHKNTDPATWSAFKNLLFAVYAPWERFDYLKAQPPVSGDEHLLEIIPPDILEAIYQSNWEVTNTGSLTTQAKAWLVCAELQLTGRGVQQSYFGAYNSLCLAQQLDPNPETEIDGLINQLEMKLRTLLNPASYKASKETILQENDFRWGIQILTMIADSGNRCAREALASICMELVSLPQIPPQILSAIPATLRKEIYESNLVLVKQKNPNAIYVQAQMQLEGFGVNKSLVNALITLRTIKTSDDNWAKKVTRCVNEITSAITTWLLPLLNSSSKDSPKADIPEYEQQALIMRIHARKDKLSINEQLTVNEQFTINEQLTITHADLIQELRWLKTDLLPAMSCPPPGTLNCFNSTNPDLDAQTLSNLIKCGNNIRIVANERTLLPELWVNIIFAGLWVQGPGVLVQLNKAFLVNSEKFWRPLLRKEVAVADARPANLLCRLDQRNVMPQFFPGSIEWDPATVFACEVEDRTTIIKQFYHSIHIWLNDDDLNSVILLIDNPWFQKKVNDGLLDLNVALKFPGAVIYQLRLERVQNLLDQHPRFLSKLDNASPAFLKCLNLDPKGQLQFYGICPEGEIVSFLFGGAVKDETLLNMTNQGLNTLKLPGVCEFLSTHPKFIHFYLTISHNVRICVRLSDSRIQQALVKGELTVEQLTHPNVLRIMLEPGKFLLIRCHPATLRQVWELRSDWNADLMSKLASGAVQYMLVTGMLTLKQVKEVAVKGYRNVTMSAQIIFDAVRRDVIPKDKEIVLYKISFGELPNGALDLPKDIKLDSCTLDSGVLTIGAKRWTGPCEITS